MRGFVMVVCLLAACGDRKPSDIVLYLNGVVHTAVPGQLPAEAIAIRNNRILAVGKSATLKDEYDHAQIVDLAGRCVVPGFIDAHGHLASLGASKRQLDLRSTTSYAEMVQLVRERAARTPAGQWILGGRWDQASWGDKEFPDNHSLSQATPDHPVLLSRVDGHAALANRKAMQLAGVSAMTKSPAGGEILVKHGLATGVLVDNAIDLVRRMIPKNTGLPKSELWKTAQRACFRVGITCVHDAGIAREDLPELRSLYKRGELKLRTYVMLSDGKGMADYLENNKPTSGERLSVRALKLYVDGSMGSRGAWMLEPYSDRPAHKGLNVMPIERLRSLAVVAARTGWQVCTHAIGDRANREALDAYALALKKHPRSDHRFRVEHAQCIHEDDIPRFGRMGVIASMQPTHATSDMRWAVDRVGYERIKGCYAWRTLMLSGARLAFGSDFPVESENPLLGFYAAVTRMDLVGLPEDGWQPREKVPREMALQLFTCDAAYAGFLENKIGYLRPGMLADFVILDRDIMTVDVSALPGTRVLQTVIGGETVYVADNN